MVIRTNAYKADGLLVTLEAEADRDGVICRWRALDPATGACVDLSATDKWHAVSELHRQISDARASS